MQFERKLRSFAADLEQGRHDQRYALMTKADRESMDLLAEAMEQVLEQDRARKPGRSPVVYCIQRGPGGPIKIGYTVRDPAERLRQFQIGSPDPLQLLGSIPVVGMVDEREIHDALAEYRLTGEWFRADPAVLAYLARRGVGAA